MIKAKTLRVIMLVTVLMVGLILAYINLDKTNIDYWYQDFVRKNEPYTLLLGSSSIHRIPSNLLVDCENPVVYGFHNGTTESIESYFSFADFEYASKVVLYIGENDIARGEQPETTFNQLKAIVKTIEAKTQGTIGIVKLKYSPARVDSHIKVFSFNRMLEKQYGNTQAVQLIPFDKMIDPQWFVADGIHLNDSGNIKFSAWVNDFCRT